MSLINQVLRDLDARHAPAVDRAALPPHIHPLPPESAATSWPLPALGLLVAAAAAWYGLTWQEEAPPAPPPRVEIAKPAPVPAPPAPVVPAAESAPNAAATNAPVAQAVAALPGASPGAVPDVAAETSAPPPAAIAEPPAKPKPAAAMVAVKEVKPKAVRDKPAQTAEKAPVAVPPPTAVSQVAAAKDAPPAPEASIDKRPRTAPIHEAADAEYRRAMSALRRGSAVEAQEGFRTALRLEGRHASARQALLSLLVESQQWGEAQAVLEEGLGLDPAQTSWAMTLARLQLENGKVAEAAETLARHARHAEQSADYQAFRAFLLQKLKRPHEAAERYRAALAIKPQESRWWYGLGAVLEADQRPQEAREAFLKARETGNLSPELATAVEQRLR